MTVIAFIVGVLLLVVGLAASIALHEIGHLVPAKRFGVRVGQYMVGFGPTLWSRRFGETEYGVKAVPLGGYISMAGVYPRSRARAAVGGAAGKAGGGFFATMVQDARAANDETIAGDDSTGTFHALPVWKRVVIMLGGPVMNLLLAMLVLVPGTLLFALARRRRGDRVFQRGEWVVFAVAVAAALAAAVLLSVGAIEI